MYSGFVYLVTNKVNGKQYVGKTIRLVEERWISHIKEAEKGCNFNLHKAIRKYGKENFSHTVLGRHEAISKKDLNGILCSEEIRLIAKFDSIKNGYNMTTGGEGWLHSDDWKKKMSKKFKGKKNPMYGKIGPMKNKRHSEEAKEKNRVAHLGKTAWNKGILRTDECKQKIKDTVLNAYKNGRVNPNKGIPRTEEQKRKQSIAMTGRKLSEEHKFKINPKNRRKEV